MFLLVAKLLVFSFQGTIRAENYLEIEATHIWKNPEKSVA
jgi:hypothetical protein